MWGYFDEFWSALTESFATRTEEMISYPISYFQNIGNAFGGAFGVFFDSFLHQFNDIVVFFSFSFIRLGEIFENMSIPFTYVFYFFKNIIYYALGSSEAPAITYEWSTTTLSIFEAIPYWTVFGTILGLGFAIVGGIATFKILLKL